MPVSVIGSKVFGNLFSTKEMLDVFSDENMVQKYLDVEAALARVQSRMGLIPMDAALEIEKRCAVGEIDLEALQSRTGIVGFPIVGLVEQLSAACANGAGEYAHWGATTQDIMDTADILQIREAVAIIERDLRRLADVLAGLALEHVDTLMAGRTHIQHALPVTFGYKAAVWLSSVDRHLQRLNELKPRLFVGQFSGAVGTLASLKAQGLEVQDALMAELELGRPDITWHTARDTVCEMTGLLAMVGGTLGKIGTDIVLMAITEVSELREPFVSGRGSSSTMPQKRNPVVSEMLIVGAKNLRQLHGAMLDGMLNDHERGGVAPWQTEWYALPDMFIMAGTVLSQANELLAGLEVNVDIMRSNVDITHGLMSAESVMMALAPLIGRQRAHDIVYECCQRVAAEQVSLTDALLADPTIASVADQAFISRALNPAAYLGTARDMVDRLLQQRSKRGACPS